MEEGVGMSGGVGTSSWRRGRGEKVWDMEGDKDWTVVVVYAFNPSTREAEAGGFLSSRPAWSTKWVSEQPGLYRETLSWKKKNPKQKQKQNKTRQKKKNLEILKLSAKSILIFFFVLQLVLKVPEGEGNIPKEVNPYNCDKNDINLLRSLDTLK